MGGILRRGALAACGGAHRNLAHGSALHRASGADTLQGEAAQHRPRYPRGEGTGHTRHWLFIDIGNRSLRWGSHLSPHCSLRSCAAAAPQLSLSVINKGVGGEIASQMLARFERDVLSYRPQLVIWQIGSNQALRSGRCTNGYADTIREGISRLKAARVDIVLMDPQFAPRVLARPIHLLVVDSIGAVANDMDVAVFQRFAVMRHWISSGEYKIEDIISSDGLHMNNVSYSCIARLLADSLVAATEPETDGRQSSEGDTRY